MTTEPTITLSQLGDLLSKLVYDPDKLRTIPDAAAYLSSTEGAVKALIKRGELKSVWIGTREYVAQSAIHEWIEASHKAQETAARREELTKRRT